MKRTNGSTLLSFALVGFAALMIGACSSGQAEIGTTQAIQPEAQIVVMTATPTTEWVVKTPTAVTATAEIPAAVVSYEAGTLLKGSGPGVFYVTEAGTRRHIFDWDTFLAFGFDPEEIVEVSDEALEDLLLAGELTRLVADEKENLYWMLTGQRVPVPQPEQWQDGTAQVRGFGVPATPLDKTLVRALPTRSAFEQGALLRANGTIYYYAIDKVGLVEASLVNKAEVIDVPAGLLATYEVVTELDYTFMTLNGTQAANLRSGPGVGFEVLGTIAGQDKFRVAGRNEQGDWLSVSHQGQTGWLAADLVEKSVGLSLLPTINTAGLVAEVPEAQPAALTESSTGVETEEETLEPILCPKVPLRGFGKVWGDHPEVQQELGCSSSGHGGEQGTNAAVQTFQNGLMLWLEADSVYNSDPVYVFFNDGSYQRFGDLGAADPTKVSPVPAGFYAVGDKFSKVYWEGTGARVKERLGYATGESQDSAGAFQQFYNGRMFWAEVIDAIFVIYDYSYYDEATEKSIQIRTWESYEDKF